MSPSGGEFSDSDSDDGFGEDMEALRRACQLTGKSPTDHQLLLSSTSAVAVTNGDAGKGASSEVESDEEGEDDLELLRCIQKRFAVPINMQDEPLKLKPLCTLPPDFSESDDSLDDYETLRAIQRRFAAYNDGNLKDNAEDSMHRSVQVGDTIIDSEKETSNNFVERTNAREGLLNCVDNNEPETYTESCDDAGGRHPCDSVIWDRTDDDNMAELPLKTSHFPTSALAFVDAIKKNRSCQKLIRSKMMQMEARIEELNKLVGRVKILKDFQAACKKRTVRALSQKKDARVQLISLPKLRATMKVNEKKIPASCKGPPENLHVANYKEAMTTFAVPVIREKWSKEEKENLVKGVKQQFQRMLLQRSIDLLSEENGSYDSGNVDSVIVSIKDIDITPEKLRLFLPKVNWEQLAAMYVPGHSGAECQARFLNYEDPLINHNPWTTLEDKSLLHIVQQKGLSDWIDIAASLGTNRTPFQCLARYQRSLNASILKREWTNEEDNQLRSAVEIYGESNWQVVASTMEGRTGTQCSNRWLKTLHPTRKRVGKWTADEDKRLIVAVTLFGPKTWKKIAGCVPGRTQVQCRERWVNCLDPSLNMADWTEEEDSKLEQAIEEHGYCWSKVAACIPRRTDNQCWRRWKVLFPTQVPLLQSARKIQKVALISNFVDRESERPALGPKDFRVPETHRIAGPESVDPPMEKKTRSRRRKAGEYNEEDARSSEASLKDVPRLTNGSLETSNGEEIRKDSVNDGNSKRKSRSKTKKSGLSSKLPNATNTSGTVIAIETNTNKYKHSDPNLEPEPGRKARKLQPRRRRAKTPEEVPELDALDDDPLYFPDSREAAPRIKAKKRKRGTRSISDCVSLDVDDRLDSEKTGNPQSETTRSSSGDDVSVYDHPNLEPEPGRKARKLQPRRRRAKTPEEVPELDALDDDPLYFPDSREAAPRIKAKKRKRGTCSSSDCVSLDVDDRLDSEKTGNPQSETKRSSNSDDVSVYDHLRDGSCSNQTLDDDMTLAHFCNQVKRRIRHQTDIIRQIKL